jgi:hypothetical protein
VIARHRLDRIDSLGQTARKRGGCEQTRKQHQYRDVRGVPPTCAAVNATQVPDGHLAGIPSRIHVESHFAAHLLEFQGGAFMKENHTV